MSESKPYPSWFFWLLASTFLWGLLIAPIGLNELVGHRKWPMVFGYSSICWIAAIMLARAKRSGSVAFAYFHVIMGIAWIPCAQWVIQAFDLIWK